MEEFSWLDVSTYVAQNGVATVFVMLMVCVFATMVCVYSIDTGKDVSTTSILIAIFITLFAGMVTLIPSHDRILAVKISKIKNELVTKDNVNKSADEISRILRKLECKYLECKNKESK